MKEITLGGQPKEMKVLKVNIGDKSYEVPLGGMLKPRELSAMDTTEKTIEFLEKYIPKKVVENLCMDDYNALIRAWGDATKEASGMSVGE